MLLRKWNLFILLVNFKLLDKYKCTRIDMANKLVPVGIARTRPRFDGKSPH